MTRVWKVGMLSACLLIMSTADVTAQNVYAEQVQSYLDEIESRALTGGFDLEGEAVGWMLDGADGGTAIRLPAGYYVAVGACDDDCSDIDLSITLLDTQEELDTDREMDSFPVVAFTLDETTDVLIGFAMPDCGTARCYAGYRWYRSDGSGGGSDGGWEEQVAVQLDALPVPEDATVIDHRTDLVDAGGEARFSISLEAGTYGGVAVCDNDCSNVDLAVYDASGAEVAADVLDDDVPVIDFEAQDGAASYEFEVRMVSCTTPACGYGFRLYRQTEK